MKKKKVLILIGVLLLVVSIGSTFAYFVSKVILNGSIEINISDTIKNTELVAIRIKNDTGTYEKTKNIPLNGYILNEEESYCGIKQDNGTYSKEEVTITYKSGKVTIDKINKDGMKCFLYFDKAPCEGVACETILANNSIDTSRSSGKFTSIFEEDTDGRIFNTQDDDGMSYFFAGFNSNNWVKFAGFYWRIIRVNGDGSIRLIYNGTTIDQTGVGTQIGTSGFNEQFDDNVYVGYMYGTQGSDNYNDTHKSINSSKIKEILDTWYINNIEINTEYSSHIDINVGFCSDRKVDKTSDTQYQGDGYGTSKTAYGPRARVYYYNGTEGWRITQTATLKCAQSNDLYTVTTASRGNKALEYAVGLITSDEVVFAGGFGGTRNSNFWLYTNQYYWTISPSGFDGTWARVFCVGSYGGLGWNAVTYEYGIRPVINLKAGTGLTGTGTTTDPYIVV